MMLNIFKKYWMILMSLEVSKGKRIFDSIHFSNANFDKIIPNNTSSWIYKIQNMYFEYFSEFRNSKDDPEFKQLFCS